MLVVSRFDRMHSLYLKFNCSDNMFAIFDRLLTNTRQYIFLVSKPIVSPTFFENLNLYFMNIAVYIQYCAVCLKINYILRCLEYICSVSSPLLRPLK